MQLSMQMRRKEIGMQDDKLDGLDGNDVAFLYDVSNKMAQGESFSQATGSAASDLGGSVILWFPIFIFVIFPFIRWLSGYGWTLF